MDLSLKESEAEENPLETEPSLNLGNKTHSQPLNQSNLTIEEELPVSTQTLDNNTIDDSIDNQKYLIKNES